MANDKTTSQAKSADVGVQTIEMLRKAELWSASICELGDKRYRQVIDKIGAIATYYRVDKSKNEIEFAGDGRPISYMVVGLMFRSIVGSVVVAAGTDEEEIRSKIDMVKASLEFLDKDVKVFHGSDELDSGLVRITIRYPHWMMREIDMVRMLDKFEETFAQPVDTVVNEGGYAKSAIAPRRDPAPRGVVEPSTAPNKGVLKLSPHIIGPGGKGLPRDWRTRVIRSQSESGQNPDGPDRHGSASDSR